MEQAQQKLSKIVAVSLLLTVVSQIVYMAALSDVGIVEGWPLRSTIWTIELLLFSIIAATGLTSLARTSQLHLAWSAIAIFGLINIIQAGIGLSMFLPATEAGEDFSALWDTVLAGAFVFFFLAKVFIGFAAMAFGLRLFRGQTSLIKGIGIVTGIAGFAAIVLNIAALPQGLAFVLPGGASGTLATLLLAVAIWLNARNEQSTSD
ncbi:MAG: hypothetical protein Pars2KO_22940 [Parasphingorhabdus sp.]